MLGSRQNYIVSAADATPTIQNGIRYHDRMYAVVLFQWCGARVDKDAAGIRCYSSVRAICYHRHGCFRARTTPHSASRNSASCICSHNLPKQLHTDHARRVPCRLSTCHAVDARYEAVPCDDVVQCCTTAGFPSILFII